MGKKKAAVEEKRKAVKVRPIERKHKGKVTQPYRIMEELVKVHHPELEAAKIVLLWRKGWKPDVDKVLKLGSMKKAGELERAISAMIGDDYDFAMQLNEDAWPGLSDDRKRHIIDHELCHAAPDLDRDGQQKLDAKERLCWRTRKHPIQEFPEILDRYGAEIVLGLNAAAQKAVEDADRPLLKAAEQTAKGEAEKAGQNGLVPKRVRLIHDCKGLGKRGSEHDVMKVERGQLGVAGPKGIVFWLREDDYEAIYTAMVQTSADWRKLPIDNLTLTDSVAAKCDEKDILTLGDFQAFQQKHGDHWARELGLRGNQAGSVMDAWEQFWANNPAYCQETPQTA